MALNALVDSFSHNQQKYGNEMVNDV